MLKRGWPLEQCIPPHVRNLCELPDLAYCYRVMLAISPPPEQRRFPRFKADIPAVASLVREREIISLRVHCNSISEGGLGARGGGLRILRLEDLVSMELHFPTSAQPIWVNTIVRYSMACGRAGQCGLQFLSVTDDQLDLVKRYCAGQPKQKSRRTI